MNHYLDDYYYQQQKADLEQIAHYFDDGMRDTSGGSSSQDASRVAAAPRAAPENRPLPESHPHDDHVRHSMRTVAPAEVEKRGVESNRNVPPTKDEPKPTVARERSRSASTDTVSTVMADYFNDKSSGADQRERTLAPNERREGHPPPRNSTGYHPPNSFHTVSTKTSPYTLLPHKKRAVAAPTAPADPVVAVALPPPPPPPPPPQSPPPQSAAPPTVEVFPSSLPPSSPAASPTGTDTISVRSEAKARWEAERNNYDSTIAALAQSVQLEKQQRTSLAKELDTMRKENQVLREMMEKILQHQQQQPPNTSATTEFLHPRSRASSPRSPSPRSASSYKHRLLLSPPLHTEEVQFTLQEDDAAQNTAVAAPAKKDCLENVFGVSSGRQQKSRNEEGGIRDAPLVDAIVPPAEDGGDAAATASEASTWCGPMHQFKPSADDAPGVISALLPTYTVGGPVDENSLYYRIGRIQPLRLTQATFREKEQTILETDGLLKAFAAELDKLALATGMSAMPAVPPSANSLELAVPSNEVERMLAAFCYGKQLDYVDRVYPPITESLGSGGKKHARCRRYVTRGPLTETSVPSPCLIQWLPRGLYTPPDRDADLLSSAGIDPQGLRVGPLGDVPVAAALAALAEATGAVTSLFASTTAAEEAQGLYSVWLCPRGAWQRVCVDGYLPCVEFPPPPAPSVYATDQEDGAVSPRETKVLLYGCSNRFTCDLWAPLCEKALAKLYGGYDVLPSLRAGRVLSCLTGGPLERWTWWRDRPIVAWEEMEAAMNTSSRGSGIVLLTTRSSVSIHYESMQQQQRQQQQERKPKGHTDTKSKSSSSDADYFDDDKDAAPASQSTTSTLPPAVALRQLAALQLRPSTSYRALAAAENELGEPMLLVRNWLKGSLEDDAAEEAARQQQRASAVSTSATAPAQRCSPSRGDGGPMHGSATLNAHSDHLKDGESCMWLNYNKEVLPLFDTLEVCFDCRRFHDVRIPVRFDGMEPSVPQHFFKVTVRPPSVAAGPSYTYGRHATPPARLWIGLHQPLDGAGVPGLPAGTASPSEPLDPECFWGLRLFLIGVNQRRTATTSCVAVPVRPAEYYMLSASYEGEYQHQPAVWMYVELDTADLQRQLEEEERALGGGAGEENSFFIIPQIEGDVLLLQQRETQRVATAASRPSARLRYSEMSCNYHRHSAVVSLLAEDPSLFSVEALRSPVEMTAAFCHEQVVCVDLDACERESSITLQGDSESAASDHAGRRSYQRQRSWSYASLGGSTSAPLQTQVNGKWVDGFCWL